VAAALAVRGGVAARAVDVARVRQELLAQGAILSLQPVKA
jgi:hypothetical protein